jgi:hypothetical protein
MNDQSELFGASAPDVAADTRDGEPGSRTKPPRRAVRASTIRPSLLNLHEPAVLETLIDKAIRGDMSALRLFWELKRRDRHIRLDIPAIETAKDALAANAYVISAVTGGELMPAEGENISSLIALQIKLLEALDHEKRIKALEKEHNHESPDEQTS